MKLSDVESWLPTHLDRARRLGRSLGPTLVQLPPRWRSAPARLDEFLAAANLSAPGWAWAVELRDPSWLHDSVFDVLRAHGAALVLHDMLGEHPIELTAPWTYVRFHGPCAAEAPYRHSYRDVDGEPTLRRWAQRLRECDEAGVAARVFFNNDVDAAAVNDAQRLIRLVEVAGTSARG